MSSTRLGTRRGLYTCPSLPRDISRHVPQEPRGDSSVNELKIIGQLPFIGRNDNRNFSVKTDGAGSRYHTSIFPSISDFNSAFRHYRGSETAVPVCGVDQSLFPNSG